MASGVARFHHYNKLGSRSFVEITYDVGVTTFFGPGSTQGQDLIAEEGMGLGWDLRLRFDLLFYDFLNNRDVGLWYTPRSPEYGNIIVPHLHSPYISDYVDAYGVNDFDVTTTWPLSIVVRSSVGSTSKLAEAVVAVRTRDMFMEVGEFFDGILIPKIADELNLYLPDLEDLVLYYTRTAEDALVTPMVFPNDSNFGKIFGYAIESYPLDSVYPIQQQPVMTIVAPYLKKKVTFVFEESDSYVDRTTVLVAEHTDLFQVLLDDIYPITQTRLRWTLPPDPLDVFITDKDGVILSPELAVGDTENDSSSSDDDALSLFLSTTVPVNITVYVGTREEPVEPSTLTLELGAEALDSNPKNFMQVYMAETLVQRGGGFYGDEATIVVHLDSDRPESTPAVQEGSSILTPFNRLILSSQAGNPSITIYVEKVVLFRELKSALTDPTPTNVATVTFVVLIFMAVLVQIGGGALLAPFIDLLATLMSFVPVLGQAVTPVTNSFAKFLRGKNAVE
jgi:hypothetical protein